MSIRIETTSESGHKVVRIEGKLCAADVPELDREVKWAIEAIVLDLIALRGADPVGVQALKALVRRGARLRGVSPYLELLLNQREASS